MLWRRLIVLGLPALLLAGLMVCLLTGCHPFHVMDGPDMEYHGEDNVSEEDSKPDAPETETDKTVTENDAEGNGSAAAYTLSDYLTVERTETPCGVIEMPTLDPEKLPEGDARLADQMFRALRDELVSLAEACQKEAAAGGEALETDGPICETRACLSDDILSVLIRYQRPDYYAPAMPLYEAVSLDVKTGEAVSPTALLEKAGYDTEEASAVLRAYAEDCMDAQWSAMAAWSGDDASALPDDWGDPDDGWQDVLDEMLREVWMEPQPLGVPWDALERSPAMFYEGGDRLSVCARIPTLAGAGFTETMVNLGHDDAAIHERNPLDCFGEPFDN